MAPAASACLRRPASGPRMGSRLALKGPLYGRRVRSSLNDRGWPAPAIWRGLMGAAHACFPRIEPARQRPRCTGAAGVKRLLCNTLLHKCC